MKLTRIGLLGGLILTGAFAQTTSFTVSGLTVSGAVDSAGQVTGTGTATISPFASGAVAVTMAGFAPSTCGVPFTISESFTFNSSDSLTLSETLTTECTSDPFAATANFNVTSGT